MSRCIQSYYKKESFRFGVNIVLTSEGGKEKVLFESMKNYDENAPKIKNRGGTRGGYDSYIDAGAVEYVLLYALLNCETDIELASTPSKVLFRFKRDLPSEEVKKQLYDGFGQFVITKKRLASLKASAILLLNEGRIVISPSGRDYTKIELLALEAEDSRYFYKEGDYYLSSGESDVLALYRRGMTDAKELAAQLNLTPASIYRYLASLREKRLIL